MKKYIILIAVFSLLAILITKFTQNSIVGKWKAIESDTEYYYIFNSNKTCSYEMNVARLNCTYKRDGKKITILYKGNEKENTYEYYFEGKTLIIKDDKGKNNKFIKVQ